MENEAAQKTGRAPGMASEVTEVIEQLVDAQRAAVSKLGLEMVPDLLIGVELRRIGGKALDHQARMARQEAVESRPAVDRAAVPQHDDRPAQLAQQLAQEAGDFKLGEIGKVEVAVKPQAMAHRTDANCRDGGNLVAGVAMQEQRGLAAGRPRAAHAGNQQKATFVQKRQMSTQAPGFF